MIVVDNDLAREGRLQERSRVDGGRRGRVEEYSVAGVYVELWRRMEMPFLKETVTGCCHCFVVGSSDEVSKRWCGGNDNVVASSGAGGS